MNNRYWVFPVLCSIPLLQSCASDPHGKTAWSVEPLMKVKNSADTAGMYYKLGRYYQGQGRFEQAVEAFRKAIVLDAQYAEAHNALGASFVMMSELDPAITEFNQAIKLSPTSAHFYNNLGYAYSLKQDYAAAVGALRKATQLNPEDGKAAENLKTALAQLSPAQVLALDSAAPAKDLASSAAPDGVPTAAVETTPLASTAVKPDAPLSDAVPAQANAAPAVTTPVPATAAVTAVEPAARSAPATQQVSEAVAPPQPAAAPEAAMPAGHALAPADDRAAKAVDAPSGASAAQEALPEAPALASRAAVSAEAVTPVAAIPAIPAVPLVADSDPAVRASAVAATPAAQSAPSSVVPAATAEPALAGDAPRVDASGRPPVVADAVADASSPSGAESPVVAHDAPFKLEIANGNGVQGMARQCARRLGYVAFATRLTNQKPFTQRSTVVQYRTGFEDAARRLIASLPVPAKAKQSRWVPAGTDVRIVLGHDLPVLAFSGKPKTAKVQVAQR